MKRYAIIALMIGWSTFSVTYGQKPIPVNCAESNIETSGHFSYIFDRDSITVEQVLSAVQNGHSLPSPHEIVNMGNKQYVGLFFSIENRCKDNIRLILRLKNTGLAWVNLFQIHSGNSLKKMVWVNNSYSSTSSEYPENTAPLFPIDLDANKKNSYVILIKKQFIQPSFSFKLYHPPAFLKESVKEYFIDGTFLGFFLFVVLFNIFLFLSLRDKVYLIYACFVITAALFYISQAGYGRIYIWTYSPNFNTYVSSMCASLWMFSFIQFTQTFTRQTASDGWLYWLNSFFKTLSLFNFIVLIIYCNAGIPIGNYYDSLPGYNFQATQALAMFPAYLVAIRKAMTGDRPVQYYLIASTFYGLALGFDALNRWNIIEFPYLFTFTFAPLGLALEVLFLSFGLTLRYHQFKHNHDKMQMDLIHKEKVHTLKMITTQDAERERIAQDLHDDLGGTIATVTTKLSSLLKEDDSLNPIQKEIKILSEIMKQAGNKIRQVVHNLMPPEFDKFGLVESVKERLVTTGYSFSVFGNERRMHPERELNIYRILMEVFTNIQKHAGATAVSVQFLFHPDLLTIVVEDDGQEGNLKNNASDQSGIGLKNINSRLLYLNGRMQSDKSPLGTTLIIDIPYDHLIALS